MADKDHLDNEISISGELTETGAKGAVRMRAASSLDRLVGGALDIVSAHLEGFAIRKRAKNEGEKQLIEAVTRYGVEKLENNRDFAERAFSKHFEQVAAKQRNKDAVAHEALSDLRENPPSEEQSSDGPAALSPEFMDRFERYAEDSSTDELRHRWGRVLASEIRTPGTFSRKVLRAVDELEVDDARLFERVMEARWGGVLLLAQLPQPFEYPQQVKLDQAGLIIDPGIGNFLKSRQISLSDGREINFILPGKLGVGIPIGAKIAAENNVIMADGTGFQLPVLGLTDVGNALATILPDYEEDVFRRFVSAAQNFVDQQIICFRSRGDGASVVIPTPSS